MSRGFLHTFACNVALVLAIAATFVGFVPALEAESAEHDRFFASEKSKPPVRGFFVKDSARTTFSERPVEEDASAIQFFPRRLGADEKQLASQPVENQKETSHAALNSDEQKAPLTPEEKRVAIMKEFGDPEAITPVKAQENAPKPFRAMLASLEAGDEELARSYALQYVRYMDRLQRRTGEGVDIILAAREREGLAEEGSTAHSPSIQRYREGFRSDQTDEVKDPIDLDERATELLREVKSAHDEERDIQTPNKTQPQPSLSRAQIRAELSRKVPVDAGSQAEILFFFRPYDSKSQAMAKELQKLYQGTLALGGRSITAIPLEEITPEQEQHFRTRTGITFSINPAGSSLAELMDIRSVPATALMAPRLNEAFVISGVRESAYLMEALNMMEGR